MTSIDTTALRPDARLVERLARPTEDELACLDAWWRANNYLTVGQIYLMANPLLRAPARRRGHQAAPARPLGHEPGPVVHLRPRLAPDQGDRPGDDLPRRPRPRRSRARGGRLPRGHLHRESTPRSRSDDDGMRRLFRQFSAPGGIPSHVSVTDAGLDPRGRRARLRARPRVRRGHGQPRPDRARGRRRRRGRDRPARGLVEGHLVPQPRARRRRAADPAPQRRQDRRPDGARAQGPRRRCASCSRATATTSSRSRATTCPACTTASPRRSRPRGAASATIQADARAGSWDGARPHWPLIVLRTPKGWTGPDEVDGVQMLGTWRAHQVPLSGVKNNPEHLAILEQWLRSYRPEELFDADGRPTELVLRANPEGDLRMSATPHANGGLLTRDLDLPDFRDYAIDVPAPGDRARGVDAQARRADARHLPRQRRPVPPLLPRRDQQQPARRRVRGDGPRVHGAGRPGGRVALAATAA